MSHVPLAGKGEHWNPIASILSDAHRNGLFPSLKFFSTCTCSLSSCSFPSAVVYLHLSSTHVVLADSDSYIFSCSEFVEIYAQEFLPVLGLVHWWKFLLSAVGGDENSDLDPFSLELQMAPTARCISSVVLLLVAVLPRFLCRSVWWA